jgi:hypothetical protein
VVVVMKLLVWGSGGSGLLVGVSWIVVVGVSVIAIVNEK